MSSVRSPPSASVPASSYHGSRRENQSISSVHASSSRSDRDGHGRKRGSPAVESAVTRLLVSIKSLLEALTKWSQEQATESDVSDVYVKLGNDFNAAVAAFAAFDIDMIELMSVPDDLRNVLETCLAEDANKDTLDKYLPQVRGIITGLLQGLRGKQSIYRRMVSEHKHQSSMSSSSHHSYDRPESARSSRSDRASRRDTGTSDSQSRLHHSRSATLEADRAEEGSTSSRRSATTPSRRREPSIRQHQPPPPTPDAEEQFVGGFVPPPAPDQSIPVPESHGANDRYSAPVQASQSRRQQNVSARSLPPQKPPPLSDSSRASANDSPWQSEDIREGSATPPPRPTAISPPPAATSPPPPTASPPQVPPSVKRYSLVDKPMAPTPVVVVDETSPSASEDHLAAVPIHDRNGTVQTPPLDSPGLESTPAVASSLAALKKSDALERRASKRFSTYNISKMTGASSRDRTGLGGHSNRRSMAVSSALTPGELAVLTEEGEEEEIPVPRKREGSIRRKNRESTMRVPSPKVEQLPLPPVPPLPPSIVSSPPPPGPGGYVPDVLAKAVETAPAESTPQSPQSFPVFLQVGREVKRVRIEPGLSFAVLRVLFVDKFSYNPGQEDFPAIYIRDPSSGVQYELEDVDEVKENCLLSLNIEPLDQIKQHIDAQISSLARDIKDLRTAVSNNRRQSISPPMIVAQPLGDNTSPSAPRPSDKQFQRLARRLSSIITEEPKEHEPIHPQMTGQSLQPQMTGSSVLSDYSSRIVTDLKTQFDEVQNLRRDLGIMRQLYMEFMKNTKESLGILRSQTQSVRQLASANVSGERAYINDGKAKLDTRSQNVLTRIEELQDLVDNVKDDVIKRHVTPKPGILKGIKEDIEMVAKELESLDSHIKTVKPMWKRTWEEELQNIVEEQQFLNHQEEFLTDLLEDHKAAIEVFGHVEKVISLRGTGSSGRTRVRGGYRPPPPDEGADISNVMLEIRSAAVDPQRRLKAIEASQKNRERELAARNDEFEEELKGFVKGKMLKMTGGAEEAERVRKKRDEMTLKAMFNGGSARPLSPASPSGDVNGALSGEEAGDES